MLRYLATWLLVLAALSSMQEAPKESPAPRVLSYSSPVDVRVPPFPYMDLPQCDAEGNLYFHATAIFNEALVLELSPRTGDGTPYRASQEEDGKKRAFDAFAVTPEGQVWMLLEQGPDLLLTEFDSDGKVTRTTHVQSPQNLWVKDFAVFNDGTFLLGGYFDEKADQEHRGHTYLALFRPSGKLLKLLDVPGDDLTSGGKVKASDLRLQPWEGYSTVGEDSNLYLLRPTEVLLISPLGEILRHIPFRKPDPQEMVARLAVSSGLLSIWLKKDDKNGAWQVEYLLVDLHSGETIGRYVGEDPYDNAACFSRNEGYVFLKYQGARLQLVKAQPK